MDEQEEWKCTGCGETWGLNNPRECNCGVEVVTVEVENEDKGDK